MSRFIENLAAFMAGCWLAWLLIDAVSRGCAA
jgi:hypothetical protein